MPIPATKNDVEALSLEDLRTAYCTSERSRGHLQSMLMAVVLRSPGELLRIEKAEIDVADDILFRMEAGAGKLVIAYDEGDADGNGAGALELSVAMQEGKFAARSAHSAPMLSRGSCSRSRPACWRRFTRPRPLLQTNRRSQISFSLCSY